jgi:NET1-associated nuclear protein 1 (U3 small nucleolar RNA-associated protein 17)
VSTLFDSSARPRSAERGDHSDVITSAILNPNNAFQLITGSLDGYIQIWDFLDAVLLQTVSIEQPIFHLCAHQKFPNYVFAAVAKSTKKKNSNGAFVAGVLLNYRLTLIV